MIDKKGSLLFLVLTFALGWPVQWAIFEYGWMTFEEPSMVQRLVLIGVLWIPAVAAGIVRIVCPVPDSPKTPWWPPSVKGIVGIVLFVPLIAFISSSINLLVGGRGPDVRLNTLIQELDTTAVPPDTLAALPPVLIIAVLLAGGVLGVTAFALIFLGGEMGWRGTLQDRLSGLGGISSAIITGLFWALWFGPIFYAWFDFVERPNVLPEFMEQIFVLAIVISYIAGYLHEQHPALSAVLVGTLYSFVEVWGYLYPNTNPPWSGLYGWISIALWGVVALIVSRIPKGARDSSTVS